MLKTVSYRIMHSHGQDVMGTISANLEQDVRERLSQSICELMKAPHLLVKQLAEDDFTVAQHIIRKSPVLTDKDLVEIAQSKHLKT